jgi:Spy/CpxP family protein refolding chaperone
MMKNIGVGMAMVAVFFSFLPECVMAQSSVRERVSARQQDKASDLQRRRVDLKRLNLTQAQKQRALDMRGTYKKRLSDLRCKLRDLKADRQKEMQQPAPDKDKLQRLSQDIGQVHGQILVDEASARSEFEKILTAKQLEEWKKMRQERRGEREDAGGGEED